MRPEGAVTTVAPKAFGAEGRDGSERVLLDGPTVMFRLLTVFHGE